ncbi:MAG: hypothetical protein ACNA7E_07695 [Wenzhouxiangellaceae bacterium]
MNPSQIESLEFSGRDFDPESGRLSLRFVLRGGGVSLDLEERFEFGSVQLSPGRESALEAALDLLHWIAGVSYWKVACRGELRFVNREPDQFQANALEQIYRHGLAELAWRNELAGRYWPRIEAGSAKAAAPATAIGLADRVLVPLGGGKDSLVALERLRTAGHEIATVQIGSAPLIGAVAHGTGLPHRVIRRRLPPELSELNRAGALNGHVPITAINAAALAVAALLWDFGAVAFANERSADIPTRLADDGSGINHQYAKSFAFECLFDDWIRRSVASDLDVFSLIRRWSELAVCREFAGLDRYHGVFSSCNRNFHLDGPRTARWCGDCPKCRFVFLGLAPFLARDSLVEIFGRDLLADNQQAQGFAELLEVEGGARPFECVGEALESRAALQMISELPDWHGHAMVTRLRQAFEPLDQRQLNDLMSPAGPDRVPERFRACA